MIYQILKGRNGFLAWRNFPPALENRDFYMGRVFPPFQPCDDIIVGNSQTICDEIKKDLDNDKKDPTAVKVEI